MSCKIHSCGKVQERHVNCCRDCLRSSACMQSQIVILYLPLNELVVSYLCKQKLAKHRIGEASCDFSRIHRVFSDNCFGLVVFESDWIQSDSEKSAHKGTKTNHFSILKCCWYISTWDVFNNPDKKILGYEHYQPTHQMFLHQQPQEINKQRRLRDLDWGDFQVLGGISWHFMWCGLLLS